MAFGVTMQCAHSFALRASVSLAAFAQIATEICFFGVLTSLVALVPPEGMAMRCLLAAAASVPSALGAMPGLLAKLAGEGTAQRNRTFAKIGTMQAEMLRASSAAEAGLARKRDEMAELNKEFAATAQKVVLDSPKPGTLPLQNFEFCTLPSVTKI